jgi:hypothetical protein
MGHDYMFFLGMVSRSAKIILADRLHDRVQ